MAGKSYVLILATSIPWNETPKVTLIAAIGTSVVNGKKRILPPKKPPCGQAGRSPASTSLSTTKNQPFDLYLKKKWTLFVSTFWGTDHMPVFCFF